MCLVYKVICGVIIKCKESLIVFIFFCFDSFLIKFDEILIS